METYKYKAKDETGKAITGVLQATDEADLHTRLRQDGKFLISAKVSTLPKVYEPENERM